MTEKTSNQPDFHPHCRYIGSFEVDAASLRITRNGKSTKLEPRAMALLLYLAEHAGRVVSRDELERNIWSGRVVGYDALNNTISKLRRALHDDSKHPEYILTIPKVGYQLITEVENSNPPDERLPEPQKVAKDSLLERKLAAILCTDVVNYSRLSGQDEEQTHLELSACLDLIKSLIERFDGSVVNFAGDAILAEFSTVSNALRCAVVVQQQLVVRNKYHQKDRKMRFRIGLNLGEVIVDRNDIYGDGVIVASRLEGLADASGICVSGSVFDAIGNKLPVSFEYLGERQVKNIETPVRAYQAKLKPGAVIALPRGRENTAKPSPGAKGKIAVLFLVLVVSASAWAAWQYWKPARVMTHNISQASLYAGTPAIAVLPFENISDDPAQEYFADGMTDDLITDLLKISNISVVDRQSVFAYKDKAIGIAQIASELGARYVLQGSVKRLGGKIRVNANLVDMKKTDSLWSERYESDFSELFSLQQKVIQSIVAALAVELTDQEKSTLSSLPTDNLEAYDYFQRAERRRLVRVDGLNERFYGGIDAIEFYSKAIELDPEFVEAYVGLALVGYEVWSFDSTQIMPIEAARKLAYDSASKIRELDPANPAAWSTLALLQATDRQHDLALESAQRAIELKRDDPGVHASLAEVLMYAGQHEQALQAMHKALELNPKPPDHYYGLLGRAQFLNRNYDLALIWLEKMKGRVHFHHELLMSYGELGMLNEASAVLENIRIDRPFVNLGHYRIQLAHYKSEQDVDRMIDALSKAGVPKYPFGFVGLADDRLSQTELSSLIAGHTWLGSDEFGAEFAQQLSENGSIAFRNSNSMLTGKAWIEENRFCVKFAANMQGRNDCGPIYRNPTGNAEDRNEYVRVAQGNLYYFSIQ